MTKSLGPAECAPTPKAAGAEAVGMTKSLDMTKSLGMTKSAGILLHSPRICRNDKAPGMIKCCGSNRQAWGWPAAVT